jgi:transposase-like protein
VSMTNSTDRIEIITSVQRRRRWTASEKVRMVEETFEPGLTVSLVARRHRVAPNQLFTWRRLVAQGGLNAAGSAEEVVPASDRRAAAFSDGTRQSKTHRENDNRRGDRARVWHRLMGDGGLRHCF